MIMRSVPPGEVLKDELEFLEITAIEFVRPFAVPLGRVHRGTAGNMAVTDETAARLGRWFGVDPQFWLNLRSQFEVFKFDTQDMDASCQLGSAGRQWLHQQVPRPGCCECSPAADGSGTGKRRLNLRGRGRV